MSLRRRAATALALAALSAPLAAVSAASATEGAVIGSSEGWEIVATGQWSPIEQTTPAAHHDHEHGRENRAAATPRQALARVESFLDPARSFDSATARHRFETQHGRELTLALHELSQARTSLTGAEARRAASFFRRPAQTKKVCGAVCVHWSTSGEDRVPRTDKDRDGKPDYVELVLKTVTKVRAAYLKSGYRDALPDGKAGGNSKTDIYLQNIGARGFYGYCTVDRNPSDAIAPGYCVLDNDYTEFRTNTPTENLQVTAAHEFFHAIQFAYDYFDDRWFFEATATWAEDELFDGVDDNRQYLRLSQLSNPTRSMDEFNDDGWHYGQWLFMRYVGERFPIQRGSMPAIINRMWELAAADGQDLHSTEAVAQAVEEDSVLPFGQVYADFSATNLVPDTFYEEAVGDAYPGAALVGNVALSGSAPRTGLRGTLDHLSSASVYARLDSPAPSLDVTVNLGSDPDAYGARWLVLDQNLDVLAAGAINLDAFGDGATTIALPAGAAGVTVTMSDGTIEMDCDQGTDYSCGGVGVTDGTQASVAFELN